MSSGEIDRRLAAAFAAEAGGDSPAAVRHYLAVLALDEAHPAALNGLGLQRLYEGAAGEAVALLQRATRADPQAAMLWLNLSSAYKAAGDAAGEGRALATALDLDPYALPALIRQAQRFERLGATAAAAGAWRTLLAAVPPDAAQPPALRAIVAHARAVTESTDRQFAEALRSGLAEGAARFDGAERRRFDVCVDHVLGKRAIYTSQCAGLHFPFLPADEFHAEDRFPWFADFEAATPAIRAELDDLLADGDNAVEAYVDQPQGAHANPWSGLNRSKDWGAYYFWHYGQRRDAACARCPATAASIAAVPRVDLPGRAPTAFFSILAPHTRIPPHTGVTNTRVTVHLPLIVPPACGFRVGGETREWVPGRAFAFDDTIEHEAWNDSDERRVVLIVDVWNSHLTAAERTLVQAFYAAADATGLSPDTPVAH